MLRRSGMVLCLALLLAVSLSGCRSKTLGRSDAMAIAEQMAASIAETRGVSAEVTSLLRNGPWYEAHILVEETHDITLVMLVEGGEVQGIRCADGRMRTMREFEDLDSALCWPAATE